MMYRSNNPCTSFTFDARDLREAKQRVERDFAGLGKRLSWRREGSRHYLTVAGRGNTGAVLYAVRR